MSFFVLTDNAGKYIRKDIGSGKYVEVRRFADAFKFDTPLAANKVLKNSIPKHIRSRYIVKEMQSVNTDINHDEEPVKSVESVHEPHVDQDAQSCDVEIMSVTNSFVAMFGSLQSRYDALCQELSKVDREISDIMHYIEINNFNACTGYKICKMLQEKRQHRRSIKNDISLIETLMNSGIDVAAVNRVGQKINNITHKIYTPRELTELFSTGLTV